MAEAEEYEIREQQFNTHEALKQYRLIDPAVPVGGLRPEEYDRIREQVHPPTTADQDYDVAWIDLEYAMAIARSDINYATEEPYATKEITAAFEAAKGKFRAVQHNADASRLLRLQALVAQASVDQHREIVTGKPRLVGAGPYLPYLKTIRAASRELLDASDITEEERRFLHALTVMSNLTYRAYQNGWFLPASTRQDWDIVAHNAFRGRHDTPIRIGEGNEETALNINPASLSPGGADEFAALRNYLEIEPPDYQQIGTPNFRKGSGEAEKHRARVARRDKTGQLVDFLLERMNGFINFQKERGLILPEQMVQEATKEVAIERDISSSAIWYLLDFDGETHDGLFKQHLEELHRLRIFERVLPEERSVIAWMELDHARMLALAAGDDRIALDQAREMFGKTITYFEGSHKMYKRLRRHGEAYDAQLAAEAAAVQRGLYTSTDRYALRRIVSDYHANAAELFVKVKDISGTADQVAATRQALSRATLALLMAAADDEIQHLVLPTSPRLKDNQTAVAFQKLYDPKVSGYDLATPIAIQLVDGDDIVSGERRVEVGRDALVLDGDPVALLRQLSNFLATNAKTSKGKQKAKSGGNTTRSGRVGSLSERLAYAISDADV